VVYLQVYTLGRVHNVVPLYNNGGINRVLSSGISTGPKKSIKKKGTKTEEKVSENVNVKSLFNSSSKEKKEPSIDRKIEKVKQFKQEYELKTKEKKDDIGSDENNQSGVNTSSSGNQARSTREGEKDQSKSHEGKKPSNNQTTSSIKEKGGSQDSEKYASIERAEKADKKPPKDRDQNYERPQNAESNPSKTITKGSDKYSGSRSTKKFPTDAAPADIEKEDLFKSSGGRNRDRDPNKSDLYNKEPKNKSTSNPVHKDTTRNIYTPYRTKGDPSSDKQGSYNSPRPDKSKDTGFKSKDTGFKSKDSGSFKRDSKKRN